MTGEEFNPYEMSLHKVWDMDRDEFRLWTYLMIAEIRDSLRWVEGLQWLSILGIIIGNLLIIIRILS